MSRRVTTATPNDNGGHVYRFVDTVHERYFCKICIHPCQNPYLSACCGHNFCKSCLDNAKKTAKICPFCRNEEFVTVINKPADREIKGLHVMCTNKERGCEWQGELNDISNHLGKNDGCQFEDVKCSSKCGKMLQRQYLTSHVETECPHRKVDCQYCHITGEHQFIEGKHKEKCSKFPLSCPNKCNVESVSREGMETHRKKCPLEVVKCSNECGRMLQRQFLMSHVETECPCRKAHCQYCHVTGKYQFIEEEHKEQCPKFPLLCPNKCNVESVSREGMEAHRKECPLEAVKCSNECGKTLQRQFLNNHVETECPRCKVDCQYCHVTGEHQFIEGEHKEQCPKLPLPCPNKCEVGSVPREDMKTHRKECPLEMVQCEYHSVGCEERMMRKDLEKHEEENIKDHLLSTKHRLSDITQEVKGIQQQLENTEQKFTESKRQLTDTRQKLSSTEQKLLANTSKLNNTTQKLSSTETELSDTHSQLDDALKQIKALMVLMHQNIIVQRPIAMAYTSSTTQTAQWLARLITIAAVNKSDDQVCPVIVKFNNMIETVKSTKSWYSNSFYTHSSGIVKGTHLSVHLQLMKGPHDDELTWPLRGKFEVKLFNQISDCKHHSVIVPFDDCVPKKGAGRVSDVEKATTTGWGILQFISNEHLHKVTPTRQYLKDDCIFLQISKFYA
ncbi:TNF receptor-associated factor 2-like isoform X1 [Dysidea avara]|uniref:TNF receptor-associated factor 2-like isoform X1 n=1 Tax=Dysidea avara TaxID=196820 RepID=UPI003317CDFD